MIVRGQRFDLTNQRQIIDFEIAKPELIPEGALQLMTIPVDAQEHAISDWSLGDKIQGVSFLKKSSSLRLVIDTASISASIAALIVVIHTDKPGMMRVKLNRAGNIFVRVNNALFDLSEYTEGRALVAFSIYRRGSIWRFRAIGESFNTGLEALYSRYTIDRTDTP